jgi:PTS system N-acetylglucosamine-specific IIC component
MDFLGVKAGFGFSAGLFDFVLNYSRASKPLLILVFGGIYFAMYYLLFRWFIVRFNVPTPGRGEVTEPARQEVAGSDEEASALLAALGGASNLVEIDACTTRLRLTIEDHDLVDEAALKSLGAAGVLQPTKNTVQVVIGLRADEIASNMRRVSGGARGQSQPVAQESNSPEAKDEMPTSLAADLLTALGGAKNVVHAEAIGTRLSLELRDVAAIKTEMLDENGFRGLAHLGDGRIQIPAQGSVEFIVRELNDRI